MENLIFRHGRIFLAKCDLYHSIYIEDLHQQWKSHAARKMRPCWIFSVESAENWKKKKKAKSGYPALIWPFRTSFFSALSWNKISHMKLQSLKMFKTTKDMFYKQFDFSFANWQADYGASWTLSFPFERLCSLHFVSMEVYRCHKINNCTLFFVWGAVLL